MKLDDKRPVKIEGCPNEACVLGDGEDLLPPGQGRRVDTWSNLLGELEREAERDDDPAKMSKPSEAADRPGGAAMQVAVALVAGCFHHEPLWHWSIPKAPLFAEFIAAPPCYVQECSGGSGVPSKCSSRVARTHDRCLH